MSIVLNTEAANTASLNNEILFVAYEATKATDPATYPDYSYVCDVYVDSVFVGRSISRPDPTHKRGIFDVATILRSYASYGLDASADTVVITPYINYRLKFGEQYDGSIYTNLLVDSTDRKCYKSYKVKPFTSSDVMVTGIPSNMPATVNYHREQLYHLIPYYSNVSGVSDFEQEFFDKNNVSISTLPVSNAGYIADTIKQYNRGEQAINIPSNADYSIFRNIANDVTIIRINHLCESKYPCFTLAWLNPFGAYESQSFGMVSKKVIELDRKEFTQTDYQINASGVVSYESNNVFYGGRRGYATKVKVKLNLTSHLLTDGEYTWLADLFKSPDVYIFDSATAKFLPVQITSNNYDYNTYLNNKLSPLRFEVQFSTDHNSQFL